MCRGKQLQEYTHIKVGGEKSEKKFDLKKLEAAQLAESNLSYFKHRIVIWTRTFFI